MCDFVSWYQKGRKVWYLTDDMIAARWPEADYRDKLGHSALREYFGAELPSDAEQREGVVGLPAAIRKALPHMREMMRAGGYKQVKYAGTGCCIKRANGTEAWYVNGKRHLPKE